VDQTTTRQTATQAFPAHRPRLQHPVTPPQHHALISASRRPPIHTPAHITTVSTPQYFHHGFVHSLSPLTATACSGDPTPAPPRIPRGPARAAPVLPGARSGVGGHARAGDYDGVEFGGGELGGEDPGAEEISGGEFWFWFWFWFWLFFRLCFRWGGRDREGGWR